MAYAFRIHEPKNVGDPAPTAANTMDGWTETSHIAGNLLGNIPLGMHSNKMGTSIPSFFARIFLFEGAFQTLKGADKMKLREVNSDTALVSECLDLIEFIFQHGNDPKLVIKHWNADEQVRNLRHDGFLEHAKLAKVIEDEISLYPQLEDIFLFFWNDTTPTSLEPREFLIGGTSPYTLVFTSPNWLRCVKENNFSFNRINGRPLFNLNNIEPLETRDSTFKDMLYSLRMAYQRELNAQAPSFNQYITTTWNANNRPQPTAIDKGGFMASFSPIVDMDGANVLSAMLPLCYKQIIPTASGYEIIPKSNRYANYTAQDGSVVTLDVPLALNKNGLNGVPYIGTSVWKTENCHINEAVIRNTEMHKRVAPGSMGVNYPFLIWSDFLEDKIIKLPYKLNDKSFVSAFNGETQYILPLKRTFFKYFNIEDINQIACPELDKKLVEIKINGNAVVVTINVPIRDTTYRVIELKKEYSGADIVDGKFLLGFFPFYRCDDNRLNRYSIMNCGSGERLNFISIDNLDGNVDASSKIRTPQGDLISQTEYYLVKTSFDLVEVSIGGVKGLIIPQMQKVGIVTNHYNFAVDFGTSNTYIAHITDAHPTPETLEIDEHDQQTVFLTKANNFGEFSVMSSFIKREFAPIHLGKNFDMSYPVRTATCETTNFEKNGTPDLFGNISIGFNMMLEPHDSGHFKYKTGLKWLLEEHPGDPHHTNRVKYFFLQTLWMLKNESLMNDGDDSFDVYITFPEAMKDKGTLMNLWDWAKGELNINCKFHYGTEYSESIAPYNYMAAQIGGSSFLNIDIGGGTNDLLFVTKSANGHIASARYSSSMFAGDDLWGDGIQIGDIATKDNGFVNYIMEQIETAEQAYDSKLLSSLKGFRYGSITKSSADVMGYLFKYDSEFQTSAKIKGQRNLYSIIFIHYAALMYNVSRIIKKMNIDIPLKLSFTGMGSKYINLMSTDPKIIKKLTVLLLEKYTGKKVDPAFAIIKAVNVDVKEITAKGVLTGLSLGENFKIPADILSPIVDYGFDIEGELTYDMVEKDEVREAALKSFNKFIDSLQDQDFINFIFNNFNNLTISKDLIADLRTFARQSFVTMSASIPYQYRDLNVTETLFFWPLKNSLVEVSKNYANYN